MEFSKNACNFILVEFLKRNKFQIIRFIFVGFLSNFLNYGIFSIIYSLTSRINIASFLGYVVGLINSFYFSQKWVFKNTRNKRVIKSIIIFLDTCSSTSATTFGEYLIKLTSRLF